MLYGKPMLNAKCHVCFGLRQVHVLNRMRNVGSPLETVHVMKHVFPRQFGLHNAFTSAIDHKETAHSFKDYMLREQEIRRAVLQSPKTASKIPRRLRGACESLVASLRHKHNICPYSALLQYYCPYTVRDMTSSKEQLHDNVLHLATPASQVSAFCRSVISHVFSSQFWGEGEAKVHNEANIMARIDRFVRLGRYESMSMHDVMQGMKVLHVPWLCSSNTQVNANQALSDSSKKKQIFTEVLYYLFDSFLIPLINNNFHVTESSTHRNQLLYFRHDAWKHLAEPALTELKLSMFEELPPTAAKRLLSRRGLGTSRVRLLPKENGLRPIINLRRRVMKSVNGEVVLGRSINSILTPAFNVLNYEKVGHVSFPLFASC